MNILYSLPLLGMIGAPQLILIVLLIVLLFGAKKIPELMRGAGRGIKEFKDAMNKDYPAEENKDNQSGDQAEKQ